MKLFSLYFKHNMESILFFYLSYLILQNWINKEVTLQFYSNTIKGIFCYFIFNMFTLL